jgi:hypothetical protein
MGFEIARRMDRHEVESRSHSFRESPIPNRLVSGSKSALLFQIHPDMNARVSLFGSEQHLPCAITIFEIAVVKERVFDIVANIDAPIESRNEHLFERSLDKLQEPGLRIVERTGRQPIGDPVLPPMECLVEIDCRIPTRAVWLDRMPQPTRSIFVHHYPKPPRDRIRIVDANAWK